MMSTDDLASQVLSGAVLMIILGAVACTGGDHGGDPDRNSAEAMGRLMDAAQRALSVDPSTLKIQGLSALNQTVPGGHGDFKKVNVIVQASLGAGALFAKIKLCGKTDSLSPESNCVPHTTKEPSVMFESAGLPTDAGTLSVTISARACTLPQYSTDASEYCGPESQIQHTLSSGAVNTELQMLENQRNGLRAQLAYWDPYLKEMLDSYAQDLKECYQQGNAEFHRTEQTRQWISAGVSAAAGGWQALHNSGQDNSEAAVPSNGVTEAAEHVGTLGNLDQKWEQLGSGSDAALQALNEGNHYAAAYYGYKAYLQSRGTVNKLKGAKEGVENLRESLRSSAESGDMGNAIRNGLSKVFTTENFINAIDNFLPDPKGTVTGFVVGIGNAIYDLSATHVLLPCDSHRQKFGTAGNTFDEVYQKIKSRRCDLEKRIKSLRNQLGLSPHTIPKVCGTTKSSSETPSPQPQDPYPPGSSPPQQEDE